jgi:alkylhydroperoxidase/carboxymuconolactone decarboxylase family protein YurZ
VTSDSQEQAKAAPRTGERFRPRTFRQTDELFTGLDPSFASIWAAYHEGLFARDQLDLRTRLLILAGQYTITQNSEALADTIEAAIREEIDLKEILEAILQCYVYGGESVVIAAARRYVDVVSAAGLLESVQARGLPVDATTRGRVLADEQREWTADDANDPRLPYLLDRYGWTGISNGLRLRPGQHINLISALDAVDPEFCQLWITMCFEGMYGRGVLDDRTRLLCVVGDCFAAGDTYQYPRHMRGALREGVTPRELLEVVFSSAPVIGHPMLMGVAINDLVRLLDDVGRLEELVSDPAKLAGLRRFVAARIAGRGTVAEVTNADGHAR